MSDSAAFNPFDQSFLADPYPYYRMLLGQPPFLINLRATAVLVTRYRDTAAILRDSVRFSARRADIPEINDVDPLRDAPTMLTSDPPVHSRLRQLVSRDFTPRRIQALEPRIRALTAQLLDPIKPGDRFDLMATLANLLPMLIISELLGIPAERHHQFKAWSDAIIAATAVPPGMPLPQESRRAVTEMKSFFAAEIERRRQTPGPDLISALIAAHGDGAGDALNRDEIVPFLILLLIAGNETTTNLIGNGLLALCRHPEQMERLRRDPALMAPAIEEMLRYDGPVQATMRLAVAATEIGGTAVPANAIVLLLLAAANRDPDHFAAPDSFDLARKPNDHLGFGDGVHFCLGAPLARLEASIAIGAVLERFPRLALLDGALQYKSSIFVRGLKTLPLATG